jgi:pyruvate formate lyase activating enzyme
LNSCGRIQTSEIKVKYLGNLIHAMKKEATLYKSTSDEGVECSACSRRCRMPEGGRGFCFVRQNVGGKLYLMNYGTLASVQMDPIEKKPFNHFMPGTEVFSVGTSSCNFGCTFCQNHEISKADEIAGEELEPGRAAYLAICNGAQGIAYTYNEPTIFLEYALDVAEEAHRRGLFNVVVTNGYMTREAVRAMKGLVDAVVVNYKGNGEEAFAREYEAVPSNEPVKDSLLEMRKAGIHIEITDLVVPRVGDSLEACGELTGWIAENLGADTPVHFLRFHPDYKLVLPPTPYETLKAHYDAARMSGLRYVYIGNVPGNDYENTYCPECGTLAVERGSLSMKRWNLDREARCRKCGHRISIVRGRPRA